MEERIFEKYARLGVETLRYGRAGPGLYLVRHIFEHHGGSASAERGRSIGAGFLIRLVACRKDQVKLGMIRIGLIEDNIEYRDNLAFFLGREGFDIAFESDGHAIDYLLALHPCDVILLDLGLPDEDGLAIARRLRAQQPSLGLLWSPPGQPG